MDQGPLLLAVPNVSEGRDRGAMEAVAAAFSPACVLDVHSDADHGRTVLTLAARQGELPAALVAGAGAVVSRVDLSNHGGLHPYVGALDVLPVVYLNDSDRGAACAAALTAANLISEDLGLPAFLYGQLATAPERRERAALREGGPEILHARVDAGALSPDFGPASVDPRRGAVLVTARPPLAAFNVELETDELEVAQRIAASIRESGGGPSGVRAIGLYLPSRGHAQVSMNVHDPVAVPLRELIERVRTDAKVAGAEVVGVIPQAALANFPEDVPLRGFDPERHVLENALRSLG